jgi:ABC-type uncharacterized transport system substrate-binding protein
MRRWNFISILAVVFHARTAVTTRWQAGKILKGATPAYIAIQQSTRVELVINRKTAQALGFMILPFTARLCRRGDRMISSHRRGVR